MGAYKNRLSEAILMSTHKIVFYEEISKITSELSSNVHLMCSSDLFSDFIHGIILDWLFWSVNHV